MKSIGYALYGHGVAALVAVYVGATVGATDDFNVALFVLGALLVAAGSVLLTFEDREGSR